MDTPSKSDVVPHLALLYLLVAGLDVGLSFLVLSCHVMSCHVTSCQALADSLSKGRHYVFPDEQGNTALDPRLLLVEFNSSILLHQSQVRWRQQMSARRLSFWHGSAIELLHSVACEETYTRAKRRRGCRSVFWLSLVLCRSLAVLCEIWTEF